MKFELGKFYRTRDGERVKCVHVFTDGSIAFVTNHSVYDTYADGKCSKYGSSVYDIIGEWSDKKIIEILIKVEVDENAKYVAVDRDGCVYQYSTKPEPIAATFRLENDRDAQKYVHVINWRETLVEVK